MNKMYIHAQLLVLFVLVSSTAMAGGACNSCRIRNIGVGPYYDSLCSSNACVFVSLDQPVGSRPPCAGNSYWHFVLDISTGSGKATFARLLSAKATGESLNVAGSGVCSLSPTGTVENLYFVENANS